MWSRSMTRSRQCWTTVSNRTGLLSAPDINNTSNSQPWKKACCGIPTRVHCHLPGLMFTQYNTWLASHKARTSSWGHQSGLCFIQCGEWLTSIFSTLYDGVGVPSMHESPQINIDNQFLQITQTGGDSNDKPTAKRSLSMASSQCWTIVSKRTGSLNAPDVNSIGNNQPWKKACCGIPTRAHLHFPELSLTLYTTWLAAQKAGA